MNVLGSLFGGRQPRNRPRDLESWIAGAGGILIVDGSGPGVEPPAEMFPEQTVLRHETCGGPGLPFDDRDPRRLPLPGGDANKRYGAIVLADVLDEVLDVGFAIDDAWRTVISGASLIVVQTVAPEDYEERAIWNAIARMRDPRHTWTPSSKQLTTLYSGLSMTMKEDAEWDELIDPTTTLRPDVADRLALMVAAAAAREATSVVRDGALVVARRATLLGRKA